MGQNEFYRFVKITQMPSRKLKLVRIDLMFTKVDSNGSLEIDASEFMELIIRIAAERYPREMSLAASFKRLVTSNILAHAQTVDALSFRSLLGEAEVQNVIMKHRKVLMSKFKEYCVKDPDAATSTHLKTVNLVEWSMFIKDHGLATGQLGTRAATNIFTRPDGAAGICRARVLQKGERSIEDHRTGERVMLEDEELIADS